MKITLLGSTGSIGTNALKVIERYPENYEVVGLAADKNVDAFAGQIKKFKPHIACLTDEQAAETLKAAIGDTASVEIVSGSDGLNHVAGLPAADIVIAAISGAAGLLPAISAVRAGKKIALANKEALVMAGALLTHEACQNSASIVPVDSEHSAIFQLLQGCDINSVRNIILTASGGPFLHYTEKDLELVTPEEALQHPRWKMGNKVTIDSASLMNKGLEIIEAHWLFGLHPDKIKVIIHPQSIIHSMVEFVDGTVFAQLSQPDMQGPIAYALSCPERLNHILEPLDFGQLKKLEFTEPDTKRFPSLTLAYTALKAGKLMPTVMNAANEVAVHLFCDKHIPFTAIPVVTETVMKHFTDNREPDLDSILRADAWAREEAQNIIKKIFKNQKGVSRT